MFQSIKSFFSKKPLNPSPAVFDGSTFNPYWDGERLGSQMERVSAFMMDGQWHDLHSVVNACGGTTASVSARIRDLRKAKFGRYTVESMRTGDPKSGVWQYRVLV